MRKRMRRRRRRRNRILSGQFNRWADRVLARILKLGAPNWQL